MAVKEKKARKATAQPTQYKGATPQRKNGLGPDPAALKAGKINPSREGKVFDAIMAGLGSTVAELVKITELRIPTVRHAGLSFAEAEMLDAYKIGGEHYFVARQGQGSKQAQERRVAVLALIAKPKEQEKKAATK